MSGVALAIDALRLGYAGPGGLRIVLDALSLSLAAGEIGCLLGASGCGKTTALRAIAGFQPVLAGSIALDGETVASDTLFMAPERRRVGLMFQDYALFPHLGVGANVGFGLRGVSRRERQARVTELLALVGLGERVDAYPHELSGGQQQRVALARALAPRPRLLLLDEPFSNLDVDTRHQLAAELRALLKSTGTTALMVTHDQAEAFAMADRIGYMHDGRLLQWDAPDALYHRPAHREVARAIGRGALVPAASLGLPGDDDVLLRPGALLCDADGSIHGAVTACAFRGPAYVITVRPDGADPVTVASPVERVAGERVRLRLAEMPTLRFPRA